MSGLEALTNHRFVVSRNYPLSDFESRILHNQKIYDTLDLSHIKRGNMQSTEIRIIGTSHISKESVNRIEKEFRSFNPDIVLIELDRLRLQGLLTKQKSSTNPGMIRQVGLNGYIFAIIGSFIQKKLGSVVQMEPGADMLKAYDLAKDNDKKILLIDQDIRITLRKFSKGFREKGRLAKDLFLSPFTKEKIRIRLDKVPGPELISRLLDQMKDRYPSIYKIFVEDRNKIMARNILHAARANPLSRMLVVVGAGHEIGLRDEMAALIKDRTK